MSKERLEEIEEHILKIDEDDSTNRSKMLDYRHWAYELLKIANEQAERVKELDRVEKQNKRYREFIETVSDNWLIAEKIKNEVEGIRIITPHHLFNWINKEANKLLAEYK